jgi:hypothetical protein
MNSNSKNSTQINIDYEEKFTISVNNTDYELVLKCGSDCIIIVVNQDLPCNVYEGIFSSLDILKKPFFKNFKDIHSVFNKLSAKIQDNTAVLQIEEEKMSLLVSYNVDDETNVIHLDLNRIENVDQSVVNDRLSKEVVSLKKSVNNLLNKKIKMKEVLERLEEKVETNYNKSNEEIAKLKKVGILLENKLAEKDEEIATLNESLNTSDSLYLELKEKIKKINEEEKKRNKILSTLGLDNNLYQDLKNFYKMNFQNSEDCIIKSEYEFNQLREWINPDKSKVMLTLLYDSLVHSDSAYVFHSRCDHIGATLSIIESDYGLRFGGYTTHFWDSPSLGYYKTNDLNAFVFSLSKMKKFMCINQSQVIYCRKDYNVTYGGGHDIVIYHNFTSNSNNYSIFGHSYNASTLNSIEGDKNSYLAGSHKFKVKKVEVYKVEIMY